MQSMEKKMSTYNKSCCNFYKRACWGWENNNILTDKDGSLDEFTLVGRKVMKEIKDQFDRGNVSGLAELKAEAFYKSCMATHRQDRDSIISQFKQLVKKANTRDLTKLLSTVHSYNVWPLFKVTSRPDPRDVSVNILTLFIGDSPFKNLRGKETIRKISDSLFDKINDSPQITDRLIDSIETDEKLSKAVSDIKDMLNSEHSYEYDEMKRRKRRHVGSSTDIDEEELSSSSITRAQTKFNQTEYGKAQLYDRLTLGELQSGCSMINWRLYFKNIFGEEISTTQKFIVYKKKNLMSSCDAVALNMTHNLSFRRYILVSLIKTSINYFDVGLLLDEDEWEGRSKTKDRWFTCMAFTQKFLGLATSSVFVRNSPSKDQISQVQEILKYLKKAFREKILQKPWLDKTTINAAVKKLDNMVDKVGYPKYIMNQTFRDTYYDQLFIASNYYNNVMFSQKFSVKQIWKDLTSPADRNKWGMVPSEVNAMHNALHNDMTVTLAIMAPPFYDPDRPISLNFGSLGAIIGHELTHAFGTQLGQFYDYEGARKAWMTRSSEKALVERAKCFIKQYDDYTIKGYEISANKTLDENIADNGGLRAAYQKDNLELNKKFYQIFTQNHFKEDELFFLSFAQMYCSKYSDTAAKYEVTESHSPGPLRVKGTLSNMAEFSSTFQCSKDQTYGREPKCQVW
ncbi:hypothetical protein FSP39_024965 [Pinctada imbricata]|uniref:Endothelin-converting enzyme 1 n=1 Tax=Pinctada imbricata TaxID=66713 RepID=A0AA88XNS2_PINIB|nr:hypothetical protein FSP39_024965 [Pinctada imbricata]